jgi:hypothetical protein
MWNADPLDRPEQLSEQGDASPDTTYCAVGRSLSTWGLLEDQFAILFATFLDVGLDAGGAGTTAAVRAFGSIITANSRSDVLTSAAEAYFSAHQEPVLQAAFKTLMRRYRKAAGRRNEIAHGVVLGRARSGYASIFYYDNGPATLPNGYRDEGYYLFPSTYATRKRTLDHQPDYWFSSSDIAHYTAQFLLMREEASAFQTSLAEARSRER